MVVPCKVKCNHPLSTEYGLNLGFVLYRFPFQDPELSPDHSSPPVVIPATDSGQCHGVVVWWSADMEGEELSMDPWNYPQAS